MGDKNGIVIRMALILLIMCLILLILVPVGSAEFYILAFSCAADFMVAFCAGIKMRRSGK